MKRRYLQSVLSAGLLALLFSFLLAGSIDEPQSLTLALLGDIMLGRGVTQAHIDGDWEQTFDPILPALQSADLALGNLESPQSHNPPLVQNPLQEYNLCAPAGAVPALTAAGLDILSLANNHAHDCTNDALPATPGILQYAGLTPLHPENQPLNLSIRGIDLAFFAFDDISAALDLDAACQSISNAQVAGSLVIVSIHWGSEFQSAPNPRQEMLAQALANCGAALIWGHHPHVLQPVEWVQGAGQPAPTLVLYSLGNALFDQFSPPDAARSALLRVTLDASGVRSWEAVPFKIDVLNGKISTADEKTASAVLNVLGLGNE
jgi:poly-gamma-glutamate capsule biosynthesis protein CapA/YwtB (metallophosphatase superfamily)